MHKRIALHQRAGKLLGLRRRFDLTALRAALVDLLRPRSQQTDAGMRVEMAQLPLQALRPRAVVGVEARQQRRARVGQTAVEGRHQPQRVLPDHPDAPVAPFPIAEDAGGIVG